MRLLSLDVGDVRIGVAISDPMQIISKPLEVIDRKKIKALDRIRELVGEYEIKEIIVGIPYGMDGEKTLQTEKVELFAKKLYNKLEHRVKIIFVDERLSTVEAHELLYTIGNERRKNHKNVVDKVAAAIILETHLKNKLMEGEK